ncbi:EAL domain-containing protein [Bacillaceae bacterium S4-13-56]
MSKYNSNQESFPETKLLQDINLQQIVELIPTAVIIFMRENWEIVYLNPAAIELLGGGEKDEFIGHQILSYIHPDEQLFIQKRVLSLDNGITNPKKKIRMVQKGLQLRYVESTSKLLTFHGQPCILSVSADITEKKLVEDALMESESRFRSLFENNANAVFSLDLEGNFTSVNTIAEQMAGYTEAELLTMNISDIFYPDDLPQIYKNMIKVSKGIPVNYETKIFHKNGHLIHIGITVVPIKVNNKIVGQYGIALDITLKVIREQKIKESEERYQELALHDPLTGLPNRRKFVDQAEQLLEKYKKKKKSISFLFIDLDRFKLVNDTMGHETGDLLLKMVATRLEGCIQKEDLICRVGGDEFIIGLPNYTMEETSKIAQLILDTIGRPFNINIHELFITPSIGISIFPKDGRLVSSLLKEADTAMYRAKELGKNNFQYFSKDMDVKNEKKLLLQNGIWSACEKQEFFLEYQPKIDLRTGKIFGLEALIRWRHPELGDLPPADFIPISEETGAIIEIGEWVIREACTQLKTWHDQGYKNLDISVNLSARQFISPKLAQRIRMILEEIHLSPEFLDLEITESMAMFNLEQSIRTMEELQAMGIKLSLDDFGTGYSSLNYLKRFPVDTLKIDRSFLQEVSKDNDEMIIEAIVYVSHSLGMSVVFEGIETEKQLHLIQELKGDIGQGYLYSKPLTKDKIITFIKNYY